VGSFPKEYRGAKDPQAMEEMGMHPYSVNRSKWEAEVMIWGFKIYKISIGLGKQTKMT
jgi:hypothetical protein